MSSRPPGGGFAGAAFFRGLISLARIALFAIVFLGVLTAFSKAFRVASLARSAGVSAGSARLAMGLIAASALARGS